MSDDHTPVTTLDGATHRIEAAAADVVAKRLALTLSLELRDGAIVEAVDVFGLSRRPAARAAGVSLPRIEAILVAGHPSQRRRREVDVDELPAP